MASASSSASSTTASSTAFYSTSAASSKLKTILQSQLKDIEDAGTYKRERVITSKQGPNITVQSSSQNVLNFCANNYLGLAGHPEVQFSSSFSL